MLNDLKQFHDAFFEESLEAIDSMESGLLNLNVDKLDIESINTIFRGAHSIKGCSATFGFNEISEYVHVMETVLDEMRDGTIKPTQSSTDILLKSLDVLREMITQSIAGEKFDDQSVNLAKIQLTGILNNKMSVRKPLIEPGDTPAKASEWNIVFKPHLALFKSGNDPIGMFSVLQDLGEISVEADTSDLLDFHVIDPEDCCLSWKIHLAGETTRDKIEEVFEWVADDCEIEIKPVVKEPANGITIPHDRQSKAVNSSEKNTSQAVNSDASSIRVGTDKVDAIINMVGELVITQSMLSQLGNEIEDSSMDHLLYEKLREGLSQLERNTREIQESVMRIRMLPVSYVFNRVPRIVHDLCAKLQKKVDIKITGENTELDKTVLEKIGDPLVHLVRNALDHGIEKPEMRKAIGKNETGTLHLNAYHKGGSIIIEIKDDGAGINKERIQNKAKQRGLISADDVLTDAQVCDLIFHAGLSTAEVVSDVSGRGVGMDVVRKNIKALGGNIDVASHEGQGTTFTIRLPLTLAILDGQLVRVGLDTYIIPLVSIIESQQVNPDNVNRVAGQAEVYRLRDEYIPFIRLNNIFNLGYKNSKLENGLIVIVEGDGKRVGLMVDELLSQQQVVIKSLESNFKSVEGISGATILGEGTVALIADISGLIELAHKRSADSKNHVLDNDEQAA